MYLQIVKSFGHEDVEIYENAIIILEKLVNFIKY